MKGLSFNVTLSDEQIEKIAAITADKVDYTTLTKDRSNRFYEGEIDGLKKQLVKRDSMIVSKEILIDRFKNTNAILRNELEKYKEEYGEIE